MKRHRGLAAGAAAVIVALGAIGVGTAPASAPGPPTNDSYLGSLPFPELLSRTPETLTPAPDTTDATVQSNLLNPCGQATCPPGPPETTTCHGVSYGKTVWYDFHPKRNGVLQLQSSGFDNVITLFRYSNKTLLPTKKIGCAHDSTFPSEELDARVQPGRLYTAQIGGVNGAGGPLQFVATFFPAQAIAAQATLKARVTSSGIQLVGLSVSTIRTARVRVSCGGFCRAVTKRGRTTERFPHLGGVQLPAGSKLTISVTAPQQIGRYIEYDVVRGNVNRKTRCLEPGSRKPRKKCL